MLLPMARNFRSVNPWIAPSASVVCWIRSLIDNAGTLL
jgi:hypothetical protein